MLALLGFFQVILRPARHHVLLVPDVIIEYLQQSKLLGRAFGNHHHVDAKCRLQI